MKNSRLISFVLSCAMVFALVVPALATDIETGTTVRGNSLLHALDTKNQEFTILEESTPALSGLPVSYQYTIERTTGEPETVQVTLNLSIQGNNKTYQAVVTGTPKVHTININNSEFEYISGPLRGNINMDGEIYNIIVGFQKHSESEDIQGDVTIQDANYEFEPMFFTFGNVTVDNELLEAIRGLNDQKMEPWDGVAETAQPEGQERSNPNYYAKRPIFYKNTILTFRCLRCYRRGSLQRISEPCNGISHSSCCSFRRQVCKNSVRICRHRYIIY